MVATETLSVPTGESLEAGRNWDSLRMPDKARAEDISWPDDSELATTEELEAYQEEYDTGIAAHRKAGELLVEIADSYKNTPAGVISQIGEGVELAMQHIATHEYQVLVEEIENKTFPKDMAFLNLPSYCGVNVPTLNNWARKKRVRAEQVERVYIQKLEEAKERIIEELGRKTPELSISPEQFTRCDLVDKSFHALTKEFDKLGEIIDEGGHIISVKGKYIISSEGYKEVRCLDPNFLKRALLLKNKATKLSEISDEEKINIAVDLMMEANRQFVTQEIKRQSIEHIKKALDSSLTLLVEELNAYQPLVQTNTHKVTTSVKKRKQCGQGQQFTSEANVQPVEIIKTSVQSGDSFRADRKHFSWLDDDAFIAEVLHVENGGKGGVAVLDMRTKATKEIEWRMGGYETSEKQQGILKIFRDKLAMLARGFAGAASESDMSLASLSGRDKDIYKNQIWYWKGGEANSRRVYISRMKVRDISDQQLRKDLEERHVNEVILFLGACDKQHQLDMLMEFTGKSRSELKHRGAGPT